LSEPTLRIYLVEEPGEARTTVLSESVVEARADGGLSPEDARPANERDRATTT
jgi:hypothetical protein